MCCLSLLDLETTMGAKSNQSRSRAKRSESCRFGISGGNGQSTERENNACLSSCDYTNLRSDWFHPTPHLSSQAMPGKIQRGARLNRAKSVLGRSMPRGKLPLELAQVRVLSKKTMPSINRASCWSCTARILSLSLAELVWHTLQNTFPFPCSFI